LTLNIEILLLRVHFILWAGGRITGTSYRDILQGHLKELLEFRE